MNTLSISIYQAAAREESPEAKLNWLDMAADRAASDGSRLLVVPELFLSGYLAGPRLRERARTYDGEYAERVGEIATLHNIAIVYTYPELNGGVLYNSAGFVSETGQLIGHHRKNSIAPGGYEAGYFTRDRHIQVFDFAGWRCAMLICYDVEFPEAARHAALQGAELIIVPTAIGAEWGFVAERMVPTRAWENGVFLAYANYAGREGDMTYLGGSRIVGPEGLNDAVAGTREEILMATLDKRRIAAAREKLPYLTDRTEYASEPTPRHDSDDAGIDNLFFRRGQG